MNTTLNLSAFRSAPSFSATALLATFLMPILTSPVALAFAGGSGDPFGNGSPFPNEGSFQATIRGTNLSGVAIFSTTDDGDGGGTFTVFAAGNTYIGNTNGAINGGSIAATFEASIPQSGTGTVSSTVASELALIGKEFTSGGTNSSTVSTTDSGRTNSTTIGAQTNTTAGQTNSTRNNSTNSVTTSGQTNQEILYGETGTGDFDNETGLPAISNDVQITGEQTTTTVTSEETTEVTGPTTEVTGEQTTTEVTGPQTTTETTTEVTADQTTETYGLMNTVANSSFNDVLYAAGSFTANLFNSFPNQQFKGKGSVTLQSIDSSGAVPQLTSQTIPIRVNGVRTSNTAGTYSPVEVETPYVYTTYSVTSQQPQTGG